MKKFPKAQWRKMKVITVADSTRGVLKADDCGTMWLWQRADGNGSVWAEKFTRFPYRNDLHRLMNTFAKATGK